MRTIFLLLLFYSLLPCEATAVLIRAPGASPLAYELALKTMPHTSSYVDYQQRKLQDQPEQERKLFSLGDTLISTPDLTVLHLKGLQAQSPWTLNSLRFVRDLSEKALEIRELQGRNDLQSLYCKTSVLLNDAPMTKNCTTQIVSLEKLRRHFPKAEKVMIESLAFSLHESVHPQIASQNSYHWTFLSNSGRSVSFYGTYEQLFRQSFNFTEFVSGTCEGFQADFDDITLQSQAVIFFNESCQKKAGLPSDPKPRWYQRKSTWMAAAGAIILGGLAYSLKGKSVAVSTGGLKF